MTTAWDDLAAENAFLRKELEARDAGILECQTRMLELERELAERDKTLADIAATDDYQARGRKIKKLKQERDEAHAAIRDADLILRDARFFEDWRKKHARLLERADEGHE